MIGTQLMARTARMAARKQWMADHLQVRGHVVIDHGAVEKLTADGKSLLPIGVIEVHGVYRARGSDRVHEPGRSGSGAAALRITAVRRHG